MPLMLFLGLLTLQEPLVQPITPKPAVQRVWKANQRDRYRATVTIRDDVGSMSAEFTMELKAPKKIIDDLPVTIAYRDETISFANVKRQVKKPGSATLVFRSTGFPEGILAKTQVATLMLPLFSWHLPAEIGVDGTFTSSGYRTEDGVKVDGGGTVTLEKEAKVAAEWTLTDAGKPFATIKTTAYLELKTGRLLRSEGTFKAPAGSAEFKVVEA